MTEKNAPAEVMASTGTGHEFQADTSIPHDGDDYNFFVDNDAPPIGNLIDLGLDLPKTNTDAKSFPTEASTLPKLWTACGLGATKFPPIRWIVKDILPAGLTVLAGKSKVGKSWFALSLALSVSHGNMVLGSIKADGPQGVLYLALEDSDETLQERLTTLQDSLPDNLWCRCEWRRGNDGITDLEATLDAHPDITLVIIDVWQKFRPIHHGRGKADPYAEAYSELTPLHDLALRRNIAIIVLTHSSKYVPDTDWMDAVIGSVGIASTADTIMVLKRNREESRARLLADGRRFRGGIDLVLDRDERCGWQIVGESTDVRITEERRRLLSVLSDTTPSSLTEIYDGLEAIAASDKTAIRMMLTRMLKDDQVIKLPDGKYLKPKILSYTSYTSYNGDSSYTSYTDQLFPCEREQ